MAALAEGRCDRDDFEEVLTARLGRVLL